MTSLPAVRSLKTHWTQTVSVAGLCLGLAACNMVTPLTPAAPPAQTANYQTLPSDGLVGKWGVASYRDEKDRPRTERMARVQCRNPVVITKGPTDGVMTYVADDPKLYELALKKGSDGKTYFGFASPPGDPQDREVLSMTPNEAVMRFVDPDADSRYGIFVYVRC